MDETLRSYDVVVVGAGPVGLLTAIELAVQGVRALVLDRLAEPSGASKALGIGPLGAEALQRRGMADALDLEEARGLAAIGRDGAALRGQSSKYGGHFAGLSLLRRDVQREPERRVRAVPQPSLEAILGNRAFELGVEVRRDREVTGVAQSTNGVLVDVASPEGESRLRCSYLVGCDGGRSSIRKLAGFRFPGTDPTLTYYQASVVVDDPERLMPVGWHRTPTGVFSYGPAPGRLVMLDFSGPPPDRAGVVTRDEIESVLRRVSGSDVRVDALESGSRWTDNTRLADGYRRDGIVLAGDAAHVHSPLGGQGLGLGLVDAANLGWKLAAVVRGAMPESLLDTYTLERRPAAQAVLANTLAQTALLRPDPQSGALRDLLASLMDFDDVNRHLGELTSGLFTRYDFGSATDEVGRLVGDVLLPDGRRLFDLLADGRGVFLDASPGRTSSRLVEATAPGVRTVPFESDASLLLRPDACVAWIGGESESDELESSLRRWFAADAPRRRISSEARVRPH